MMNQRQPSTHKVILGAYAGVIVFTIASLLGPILWERAAKKERKDEFLKR